MMCFMIGRLDIGEAKINILGVASVRRDLEQLADIFPTVGKGDLSEAIGAVQPDSEGKYLDWHFNSALIRIPNHTILIDTGFGFSTGRSGLGIAELLCECEVRPAEVNTVVITHGHGDHIGGLTEAGAPSMPDARVVMSRQELEFWMNGQAERFFGAAASSAQRTAFSICRSQIECIEMDSSIAESKDTTIRALPAPGHTPGHIGIAVRSQGHHLWLLVDTIHALFQMQYPDWSPRFDVDPDLACSTRKDLLAEAAGQDVLVQLYHFPFPGTGSVKASKQAWAFEPGVHH
jgi:glyoxylase-like metal-dependent hydrolase (beta-lactamase superfamily II)